MEWEWPAEKFCSTEVGGVAEESRGCPLTHTDLLTLHRGDRGLPGTAHSATCSIDASCTSWAFWCLSTLVPSIRL